MAADLTERLLCGDDDPRETQNGTKATTTKQRGRRRTAAWTAVGRFLSMAAMLAALFAALVLIVVPVATGSQTYTVLTNSMAPKYPPGTFMVMKPAPFDQLKYGDVITFQLYSGRPEVETHRIVGFGSTQQGEKTLITKGDNNGATDENPVRAIQVKGKLFYAVPYVGFVANFLGNSDRGIWTVIAAVALIGYGAITIYKSVRKTRSRDHLAGGDV
ncbi:signal peptidase [Arthrobacter sp. B2I5]|uniref:signal peptidase I n=1 Tax=Arthrobacter sp. B2I5 TaxID=3042266 RepID=UPI00277D4CEC|nr:signal peptidase I [Arthrobacter sp. B2I5]MDQ0824703.1 signal peptidase [Arthrobacter sp. B2I5]